MTELDLVVGSVLATGAGGPSTEWSAWIIAVFIVFALGVLLLYVGSVLRYYLRIMVRLVVEYTPTVENGGAREIGGEVVDFPAADGHPLQGVILHKNPGVPRQGMVVFAHEFASDRTSCIRYAKPLLEAGYDLFAFDFRGHGGSPPEPGYEPRQWPTGREKADMVGAVRFIGDYLSRKGLSRKVAVFGISRGAGAAIVTAAEMNDIAAIVTDGAYSSDRAFEYLVHRFATIFARIPVLAGKHPSFVWRFLRRLLFWECSRRFKIRFEGIRQAVQRLGRRPILLIHGEKDSYVPVTHAQYLYERAYGPKYLWVVPGAKHNQGILVREEEYGRRVVRFLEEHLATEVERPPAEMVEPAGAFEESIEPAPAYARIS